jgi:hypothetical protein
MLIIISMGSLEFIVLLITLLSHMLSLYFCLLDGLSLVCLSSGNTSFSVSLEFWSSSKKLIDDSCVVEIALRASIFVWYEVNDA